jgi:Ca2+-binding RTX toxin-like protein
MRRLLFFLIYLLLAGVSGSQAQNYTLTISPTSGAPGTTVTLSPNPTYNDERCFANGTPISRTYTVPNSASGTITFYCEAGTGEFYSRTNDATFTVTAPDSDGDGIPDDVDQCPNQPAPNSNNGCPPQPTAPPAAPNPPPAQPEQPAPPPANRDRDPQPAPIQSQDVPTITQPEPVRPQIVLPEIPEDDICQIATNGTFRANVRANFSTDAQIVDQLDPERVVPVQVQATLMDERYPDIEPEVWLKVETGWVAGQIMRMGGNCDDLPDIMLIDDEPRERPEICAGEPFVVVFDDFNPETRRQLWGSVLWRLDYVDEQVSGHTYTGTPCDEYIFATDSTDIIDGGGGNDWIFAFGGTDIVLGGKGDDFIWAGDDNDFIVGADGDDRIYSDYYLDEVIMIEGYRAGFVGADVVYGNGGDDYLMGGGQNDLLMGNAGDDFLGGDWGDDHLYGGAGNDRIWTGYDEDYAVGGSGDDSIHVISNRVSDRAFGNDGDDFLIHVRCRCPYRASSFLSGGPGDDVLNGFNLHGGDGDDDLRVRPRAGTAWASGNAGDDVISVSALPRGSGATMFIFGGPGNDRIIGNESTDVAFGGSGDDYILGYNAADYLDGGDGDDEIYGSWPTPYDRVSILNLTFRDDNDLVGGAGADIIDGGPSDNDACITDSLDTVSNCDTDAVIFSYRDSLLRWLLP